MKITFTPEAQERLQRYLSPDKKMVLDYEDGVGPFSAVGNCSLDDGYRLIFVGKDLDLPDFNKKIDSNLGDIYIKGYTDVQFADQMEVRFNPKYFTMPLVSPLGVLTDNIEVVDFSDQGIPEQVTGQAHDC